MSNQQWMIMQPDPTKADASTVLEFMFRLGQAYLACGEQTALVQLFLRRIATVNGMRNSRVIAFPTALFITFHDGTEERVTLAEAPTQTLRLDQIADVYTLGDAAIRGTVSPQQGLERLVEIHRKKARFGVVGVLAGHTILTVGLAAVLEPVATNLVAAAVLGLVVAVLKVLNRDRPILSAPLSVVAATLVSMLVFLALKYGLISAPQYVLIPPLVTFLPGAMLTFGMVELAFGDMVSGSARLITGFVQLVLLAFGLAAGAAIVGYSPANLLDSTSEVIVVPWTAWAPWIGVVVFGIGAYLHFSAPYHSFPWMLLVLLVTFGAQQIGAAFFNYKVSGFFGMLVATPLGYLIQQKFHGPPAMVTFLPSFWLLVPGSLGLLSVTQMLSDRAAGFDGMVSAVSAIASIALGTLVGASLYKWLTERFDAWQLQIGRASTYFRRKK